ncbi:MAG TPA: helix-turn-helix transcriptional regulator [Bryobacteraceae bacterium]|nr:helix-turn-helix transcriptional regulator [Bryobacteraceae bacterium]
MRPEITPEQAFAKALREVRNERGVSQEDLAFESGYHRTYVGLLERAKMNPSLRTILALAAVLETPAAEIVRRVEGHLGKPWRPEKEERGRPKRKRAQGPAVPARKKP